MTRKARLGGDIHKDRFIRHVSGGQSPEDIAKADGVSLEAVRGSIEQVRLREQLYNLTELITQHGEVIAGTTPLRLKALTGALEATKVNKKGVVVPDHATRLEAVKEVNHMLATLQPKGGRGIQVGVQVNTGGQAAQPTLPPGSPKVRSFEDLLRTTKALPASSESSVQEGEVIETSSQG
jgi:hypothetical protein